MNGNMLIQHFVYITRLHSTQHPDYFVWSENHETHKLVKMKIHIGTNKFKARWVNRKKIPNPNQQTTRP